MKWRPFLLPLPEPENDVRFSLHVHVPSLRQDEVSSHVS